MYTCIRGRDLSVVLGKSGFSNLPQPEEGFSVMTVKK